LLLQLQTKLKTKTNLPMITTIRLKPKFIRVIQDNPALQGVIAQRAGKSNATIMRWCKQNAAELTMLSVLLSIRDFLQLPKGTALTEISNDLS
jgi:hypothetical protein